MKFCQPRLIIRDSIFFPALVAFLFAPNFALAESPILDVYDFAMLTPVDGVELGKGPEALGQAEPFLRFTDDDQHVDFELECHAENQNYLTVKVWGSSGSDGYRPGSSLLLRDPIPLAMTQVKSTVRLRLVYKGQAPGLEVYRVYTHLDPFFDPPADEVQGPPFELGPPRERQEVSAQERFEHWKAQANSGFEKARQFQLFGERWEVAQSKNVPTWAKGAILGRGAGSFTPSGPYTEDYEVLKKDIKRWGTHFIRQADSQMLAFRYVEVYAHAYCAEWSDYHQDREMLERIVAAFDFYSRAQGHSGGFMGPHLPGKDVNWPTWLGGPHRSNFSRGLEVGQRYFWDGFHMVLPDLDQGGFLETLIDDDLDPNTPEVSRRVAYARMARRSFDLYSKQVAQCSIANQMIHNVLALNSVYQVIKVIDPTTAIEYSRTMETNLTSSGTILPSSSRIFALSKATK